MTTQIIFLNGGSSSGKSGIARCLQVVLPDPWLAFGIDALIEAMPPSVEASATGIEFAPDGSITVGPGFRVLEAAWLAGIAAMARSGARIILDDALLSGSPASSGASRRWPGWRCCGSASGVTPKSPRAAKLPAVTGSPGWPPPRPTWSTRA